MPDLSDDPRWFKPESIRGAAGFFRVGQMQNGAWSLIDPDGAPFFAAIVNAVDAPASVERDALARLRSWSFNTLGLGSAPLLRDEGLAWVASADFSAAGALIHASGIRLPDVFDATWAAAAMQHAEEVCWPLTLRRDLLGWFTDDDLGWGWPDGSGRPTLLQTCLSLEPGYAAYHAAWEFVLAAHGGRLAGLAKAWAHSIENKEMIREMTRTERGLATRGYLKDNARWTAEFAQRYFAVTLAAISAADPNHLLLGVGRIPGTRVPPRAAIPGVVTESFLPAVDLPWMHWQDIAGLPPGPVLAGDFTWASEAFRSEAGASGRGLTSLERMLKRGRAALRRVVSHPYVVGYAWNQWRDDPGEQPPFGSGLIHANDVEAREHTELVADINRRIPSFRGSL